MPDLKQDRLKELLGYDPETGLFTWKVTRGGTARAGTLAGTLCKQRGYFQISIDNRLHQSHRLAWFYTHGVWPDELDHINRVRTDNRLENLREVTSSQNNQNASLRSNNTSGFKGVSFCSRTGRWRAQIRVDGKGRDLGRHRTPEEAFEAYRKGAAMYHTHNFLALESDTKSTGAMGQINRKTRSNA